MDQAAGTNLSEPTSEVTGALDGVATGALNQAGGAAGHPDLGNQAGGAVSGVTDQVLGGSPPPSAAPAQGASQAVDQAASPPAPPSSAGGALEAPAPTSAPPVPSPPVSSDPAPAQGVDQAASAEPPPPTSASGVLGGAVKDVAGQAIGGGALGG